MDKFSKLEDIINFWSVVPSARKDTQLPTQAILTNLKLEPITVAKNNKKQFALN